MIVLIAREGDVQTTDVVEVSIGGSPDLSRAEWLSRLGEVASLVAAECHSNDVPPVIRVGGGAKGYGSLKTVSGVTDLGHVIKNFPWDVFAGLLKHSYDAMQVHAATLVAEVQPEASALAPEIEQAALRGNDEALTQVIGVAAGDDPEDAEHAKEVLTQVPLENLQAWDRVHGQ